MDLVCIMIHSLKDYIEQSGTTQRALARQLEISTSYVNMLKDEVRRPSPELALRIERVTGIPFRKLLLVRKGKKTAIRRGRRHGC